MNTSTDLEPGTVEQIKWAIVHDTIASSATKERMLVTIGNAISGAGPGATDRPVRKEELFQILGWRPSKVTLAAWKRDGLIEAYALPGSKSGRAWAYSYNSIMRFLDESKKAGRRSAGHRKEAANE